MSIPTFLDDAEVQIGVDQANPLMLTVNGKLFDVTWEPPPEPQLMRCATRDFGCRARPVAQRCQRFRPTWTPFRGI